MSPETQLGTASGPSSSTHPATRQGCRAEYRLLWSPPQLPASGRQGGKGPQAKSRKGPGLGVKLSPENAQSLGATYAFPTPPQGPSGSSPSSRPGTAGRTGGLDTAPEARPVWRPGEGYSSRFKVNLAGDGLHHPKGPFLLHRWGQAAVAAPQGGRDSPPRLRALSTAPTGPGVRLTTLLPEGLDPVISGQHTQEVRPGRAHPSPDLHGTEHKKPPFLVPGGASLPRGSCPHGPGAGSSRLDRRAASRGASRRRARAGRAHPRPREAAEVAMAEPGRGQQQVRQGQPCRDGAQAGRGECPQQALLAAGTCGLSTGGSPLRGHLIITPTGAILTLAKGTHRGGPVWTPTWPAPPPYSALGGPAAP
uniref:Uncharacterized protein n=1 Tax=Rangifer tarandus platyrhynchus TaxID=3082113 RepID=A0ACB0F2F8_RANTA|nr:unnamed protein product [Rangifer tarandus platyrhynchus]